MTDKRKMITIGLTGGAGSGKSTAAALFQKLGARVIDADRIGHHLLSHGSACHDKVVKAFGPAIVSGGRIDRKLLGKMVFGHKRELEKLNRIVRPYLLKEIRNQIAKIKNDGYKGLVIVDAALVVPWGLQKKLDLLVVVDAPVKARIERLQARGYSLERTRKIMASQLPAGRLKREADLVIANGGSLSMLKQRVKKVKAILDNNQS
jgi:dephospho-CoA kinase